MGCTSSKEVANSVAAKRPITTIGQSERLANRTQRLKEIEGAPKLPPKLDHNGRLMPEEVVRRSSSSITNKTFRLGSPEQPITVQYAHWTQRGYYPDDPHKENQDEYSVSFKFAGGERDAMFAVYDGHGKKGHDCSRFVKKKLPNLVAKHIRQARVKKYQEQVKKETGSLKGVKLFDPTNWPTLTSEEYQICCERGFVEANKEIHKAEKVEDTLSGTTAITASFHETLLTVCNVGDSRAVLGHHVGPGASRTSTTSEETKEEIGEGDGTVPEQAVRRMKEFPPLGSLLAIPLSKDQTPYRKDERERVKLKGASIMSIDQMEGKEEMHENWGDLVLGEDVDLQGDPPRVWAKGKDYPGTAFTRAIGDSMAESIGVNAEPEMLARHLTSNDHLLVIASDGIFEFLTNQEVVDLCAQCETPIIACETLVKRAYNQWLKYENRTDDITVIVCFLTVNQSPPTDGTLGTTEDLIDLAKSVYGEKPIRKSRGEDDNLSTSSRETPKTDVPTQNGNEGQGLFKGFSIFDLGGGGDKTKEKANAEPNPASE